MESKNKNQMGEIENKNTKTREKRIFRTKVISNDDLNCFKKSHNKAKEKCRSSIFIETTIRVKNYKNLV
jgi:hypothetical protein